jgi:hypothetical protein
MWTLIKQALNIMLAYRDEEAKGKPAWRSKRVWGLIVSAVALACSQYAGVPLTADQQLAILTVIGVVLGLISKGSVGFYEDKGA